MKKYKSILVFVFLITYILPVFSWSGTTLPRLHIEDRYLKDSHGNIVNLHGFAQTYSPFFNEGGQYWNNYDVQGCLAYNQNKIDEILSVGWKVSFVRMHMDPYWSNTPGCTGRYEGEECFNESRFRKYLDEVFIPMAEYAVSKGIYVVMRPPGVCPHEIYVNDVYNNYLIQVWTIVAQHPKLQNHPNIMFELANEPVNILGPQGDYGAGSQGHYDNLKTYFQSIVDAIRVQGANNILWIPGLGYQSHFKGLAVNPIEGENIGYAVHIYPGWLGSDGENEDGGIGTGGGYETFQAGWDELIKPVADFAPVMITEMDWAPSKYNASWGKSITGEAGGIGFGANMKKIVDASGNVSWLIFTEAHRMADFSNIPPADGEEYSFLNDPEACPWPTYHWYEEYALENYPRPEFQKLSTGDNGDGTYTNPVIHAEFPDPDVIRVGDIYYMVSTTMHFFPGATIIKSYDLVNWEFCSNPLEMIEASDCYNMDANCDNGTKFRYATGQWATSLRYHKGKYYLLFNTNHEGGYLLTADDPEGNWEMKKLSQGYYDPGLFFDNDDRIYIVHGINEIRLTELNENFEAIKTEKIYEWTIKEGLEGCHMYKINDYYYIYATYGGFPAYQVALRSKNIWGAYEEKFLLDDDNVHQGALIQTQTGEWWTMLFYDKMPYGRMPNLQPITWENGWPMIGEKVGDEWKAVKTYQKPDVGAVHPRNALATNDHFRDYKIGLQWAWNHNPDYSKFSLFERPGYLRLRTASVVNDLSHSRNTLTQRIFGYQSDHIPSYATIKIDVENMIDGDIAGLTAFTKPETYIAVRKEGSNKRFIVKTDNNVVTGNVINQKEVYLRLITQFKYRGINKGQFYYSLDNLSYYPLGPEFELKYTYDFFVAPRYGLFNFATKSLGGYVDIDWFTTEEEFEEDMFFDDSFAGFSEDALTPVYLEVESESVNLLIGTNKTLRINCVFADGHKEDVTSRVEVINSNPKAVRFVNGQLIGQQDGLSEINIIFQGLLGHEVELNITVESEIFPLTNELFNPRIFGEGYFDETENKIVLTQYGFGGWEYKNGLNISNYEFLVIKFKQAVPNGVSFQLSDQSSYWTTKAVFEIGGSKMVKVDLQNLKRTDDNDIVHNVDPSKIHFIGFWSFNSEPILIDEIYLDGLLSSVEKIQIDEYDENKLVDVYNILGVKLKTQVMRKDALNNLYPGIYIIEGEKFLLR